jgi:hypothetical protein
MVRNTAKKIKATSAYLTALLRFLVSPLILACVFIITNPRLFIQPQDT